jgi:hypothetical protein
MPPTGRSINPPQARFVEQLKPAFVTFPNSLISVEQQLASASGSQCLIEFESELAQIAAKANL